MLSMQIIQNDSIAVAAATPGNSVSTAMPISLGS